MNPEMVEIPTLDSGCLGVHVVNVRQTKESESRYRTDSTYVRSYIPTLTGLIMGLFSGTRRLVGEFRS